MPGAWSTRTHRTGPSGKSFNGDMLKIAREARGLELPRLSELSKIPLGFLESVENGMSSPLPGDEIILCTILDFPLPFFYRTTIKLDKPDIIFEHGEGIFPCVSCGCVADYLCDFPVGHRTCDAHICELHRTKMGDCDLCHFHAEQVLHSSTSFDNGGEI